MFGLELGQCVFPQYRRTSLKKGGADRPQRMTMYPREGTAISDFLELSSLHRNSGKERTGWGGGENSELPPPPSSPEDQAPWQGVPAAQAGKGLWLGFWRDLNTNQLIRATFPHFFQHLQAARGQECSIWRTGPVDLPTAGCSRATGSIPWDG